MGIEKIVRAVMVGFFLSIASLIGLGWKAYGKMDEMRSSVKKEIKQEMIEIRNRDMDWIQSRFNSLEYMYSGRVVSPQKKFEGDKTE